MTDSQTERLIGEEPAQRLLVISHLAPLMAGKTWAGNKPVDAYDLIRVAHWVITGRDLMDDHERLTLPPPLGEDYADPEDDDDPWDRSIALPQVVTGTTEERP